MIWTPELDAEITRLTDEGLSRSQVAVRLGVTKNAIGGRMRRRVMPPAVIKPRLGYSTAQLTLFKRLWTTTVQFPDEICAKLNSLGPATLQPKHLRNMSKERGWRRPAAIASAAGKKGTTKRWGGRKATPPPKPKPARSIPLTLREVYQRAAALDVPRTKRGDIDALNHAMRRVKPDHPGFVLAEYQPTRLTWAI